jgi:hypothetical protein
MGMKEKALFAFHHATRKQNSTLYHPSGINHWDYDGSDHLADEDDYDDDHDR